MSRRLSIEAATLGVHALGDAVAAGVLVEGQRDELAAVVGVSAVRGRGRQAANRHVQRIDDDLGVRVVGHRSADDPPRSIALDGLADDLVRVRGFVVDQAPGREPTDLVFPGERGEFLDGSALRRRYKKALEKAALRPLRFHDLRHIFGSIAINQATIVQVQAWMGAPTCRPR